MSYSNDNTQRYTIVTAFYLMKSKFHPDKYKQWISNFMKLKKMNCLLYTNEHTKKWMQTWMNMEKVHIEIIEMEDFITAKYDWDEQYKMDDEKDKNHSRELYMIWNEKINFLKLASEKNPYQTEWFLWCDMGSLRQQIFESEDFTSSPELQNLDGSKTYFFRITNSKIYNRYFIYNLNKYFIKNNDVTIIQGGFILTNLFSCNNIHQQYYELLDKLYNNGLFIGKDQCCYISMVNQSKDIKVLEIKTHKYISIFSDPWFFVYPFMLGVSEYNHYII